VGHEEEEVGVRELLERYNREGAVDPENRDGDYKGIRSGVVDKAFRAFRERVDRSDPSQVVRYDFGEDTEPLWVSDHAQLERAKVPACENCGAERWFELQVLPQALHYLKPVKGVGNGISHGVYQNFDFGTIVVYSCSKSCDRADPNNNEPLPEFAYHQPHSAHG
jgi:pre-rRNA-processing protein TSR4